MSIGHLLEAFDASDIAGPHASKDEDAAADLELEIFERGYKAGWEDSHKAELAAQTALHEDFAQNIRDLSFTYHEAYAAVLKSLQPMVCAFVEQVLPDLALQGVGKRLAAELEKAARHAAGKDIEILCHESMRPLLKPCIAEDLELNVRIMASPALNPGQAQLRFADREIEFDTEAFASELSALSKTFFSQLTEDKPHV